MATVDIDLGAYQLGWRDDVELAFTPRKGLDEEVIRQMSAMKNEPEWMLDFRLKAYQRFLRKPIPQWGGGGALNTIDFDDIYYYVKPAGEQQKDWDMVPESIKTTYERLGIPEAERKYLAGVTAQYESEVVYHRNRDDLEKLGVLFCDMDTALREYPEIVKEYFGTIIPPNDNKFAALNSAVWSGGSFIYVPPGVHVDQPLQAYFRINSENMGQFERTLIIVDEGAYVHYVEGCSAPVYTTDSLHAAVVEIVVKEGGRCRYTTIQNWSNNVFNLVTKRAAAYRNATMEWVDGNLGCLAEGSLVTTRSGPKPIELVQPGDEVMSWDESIGAFVWSPVTAKRYSGEQAVREIRTGVRRIKVTDNHPFYSVFGPSAGSESGGPTGYVRADQLDEVLVPRVAAQEVVHSPRANRSVETSVDVLPESLELRKVTVSESLATVPTWDIEVAGTGNFVAEGFIVHNSRLTMKYPAVWLMEPGAHGEVLSIAFAGEGQHQDAGGKIIHVAPDTTSTIISKSISKSGGRAGYRGLVRVEPGAENAKSFVRCDALILDEASRSDTYPYMEIEENDAEIAHEATVSKVGEDQLFYLMSRGLTEEQATSMIVAGFIEPIVKELPMEYAVEMNRLIELNMAEAGAVG
jgi:Fe-S cluster assembly scaffold protein SufB